MEGVDQEFVFVLAGSFFCAFLAVVAIGGAFLLIRLRQQERSGTPAPEPPAMTRDEHASPPSEYRPPAQADPTPEPPTTPAEPLHRPPLRLAETPTLRPAASRPPPIDGVPLGLGDGDATLDEDAETRVLPKPAAPSEPSARRRPPPLTPISLTDALDDENPTVIVDRTPPSPPKDES